MNAGEGQLPFVLSVDVEPDKDAATRSVAAPPWRGFEAAVERLGRLRPRLAEATGAAVHFNWFLRMDERIADEYGSADYAAQSYAAELAELQAAGDLIGLHPHAWRWREPPGEWIHDHADDEWLRKTVRDSFAAYEAAFGRPCLAHRYGSRFLARAIVDELEALGARVDLTLEPGGLPRKTLNPNVGATGSVPDQRRVPRRAHRPGGATTLWELPLSAFDPAPLLPRWRRLARRVRFIGTPLHRPAELWSPLDANGFWRLIEGSLRQMPVGYVNLAIRSDAAMREPLAGALWAKMEALLAGDFVRRVRFTTAVEAIDALTAS